MRYTPSCCRANCHADELFRSRLENQIDCAPFHGQLKAIGFRGVRLEQALSPRLPATTGTGRSARHLGRCG
ncbi:hypothetical protein BRN32_01455 [Xanthomonas oryzae pv. oryzae]|nr:hypothetical protein BRN32_01455 [Xanthomonas oryzae pv. oryzae]